MSGIPLFVDVEDLRVLVVGGGAVATRKVKQLAGAHAQLRVIAPEVCDDLALLIRQFAITLEERRYQSGDVGDAQLVFAATNDREVNQQIAADANASNRLVNVTDDSHGGMFSVMATHRRGPLTIAVHAGGAPAAALRIRAAIAERFDSRYGDALDELVKLRRKLLAEGKAAEWHTCAEQVVDADFCDTVEQGNLSQRIAPWR